MPAVYVLGVWVAFAYCTCLKVIKFNGNKYVLAVTEKQYIAELIYLSPKLTAVSGEKNMVKGLCSLYIQCGKRVFSEMFVIYGIFT